ncbi:MAG: RNA polymerase sigma factor [Gemmataceae bacterium]
MESEDRERDSTNPVPTSTSRSLLERVKEDDSAAWNRLVALYAPLVMYWCRRDGVADEDVPDIFQEVFLAVAKHIANFRKEHASDTFRGWLRTITRNKVNDHFRAQGKQPHAEGGSVALRQLAEWPAPAEPGSIASVDDTQAEQQLYQRCLHMIRGEFEEKTWQAFWRTAVQGRSARDVGDELGMSPGAVRVAKSRVLQRLREELGDLL